MIVDAGHLSVGSNLVDKTAVNTIKSKRNQPYEESDFTKLESLMYDKFTVKIKDAQVGFRL
jgi:vacuolar protein sorting-associated protein 13A/C